MSNNLIIKAENISSSDYNEWFENLKKRYRKSQIKAAVKVNYELLKFYWSLGKDIVEKKAEEKWGSGIIERLSLDFKEAFPKQKGFSTTNLWYIKKWYVFYSEYDEILHQVGGEFHTVFFSIPWRHHVDIITKCKSLDEAFFYIKETVENNWSRAALEELISSNLYLSKGKSITNFS